MSGEISVRDKTRWEPKLRAGGGFALGLVCGFRLGLELGFEWGFGRGPRPFR